MIRMLAMAGGLVGAAGLSQFPEFSQQYMQRLSGAVNELRLVVSGFDVAAAASGKTRQEALAAMQSEGFESELKQTIENSIARFERLNTDLEALSSSDALGRLAQPWNFADQKIFQATLDAYQPAIPVTSTGAITSGIGFVGGWAMVGGGLSLLMRPFRRNRRGRRT